MLSEAAGELVCEREFGREVRGLTYVWVGVRCLVYGLVVLVVLRAGERSCEVGEGEDEVGRVNKR